MARSGLSPFRATVWLLLIFTPLACQQQVTVRAESYVPPGEIAFWAQLIERAGCREVMVLDVFGFLAQRPAFGRQLFARLYETGYRVSVWRHLDRASPLLTPLHRLAIIVPIVMKPSVRTDGTLRQFFQQLVPLETLFTEPYSWMLLISPEHDATVKAALRNLPLRADSNVYCVTYRPAMDPFGDGQVHLGPKVLPTDRPVRRMQTIHPEVAGRTLVELTSPVDHHRNVSWPAGVSGGHTVQQLYRLQTRTKTIDVSVELLAIDDTGRMVLDRPLVAELRNDFFHLVRIPIRVFWGTKRLINRTFIADTLPLFRNARIAIFRTNTQERAKDFNYANFFLRPVSTYNLRGKNRHEFSYSLPVFHDHLSLYIRYHDIGYDERSSKILLVVLLPISLIGMLFCLSLLVAFNLRKATGTVKLTLADSLIWFIGVTAQQGSLVRPNSLSTMMLTLVALLFSSIMYCTYLSRITSQLSVDVEALDYLDDLLETDEYRIGFVGNASKSLTPTVRYLNTPIEKVILQMEEDKTLYADSYEEGIRRVLQSNYGLISTSGIMRKVLNNHPQNESCLITELQLDTIMQNFAFEMASLYAYRKMINYAILRCKSSGITKRISTELIPRLKSCGGNKQIHAITISHIELHFYLLTGGVVVAVLVLGLEFVVFYRKKLKQLLKQQIMG